MIVKKAYNIRLYPSKQQENFFNKTFGCSRLLYNVCLGQIIDYYKKYKKSYSPKLKDIKLTYRFMKNADSQGLANSYMDLMKAFTNFFGSLKKNVKYGFPKFKNKNCRKSYRNAMMKQDCIKESKILIPKAKWVKYKGIVDLENIKHIWNLTISKSKCGNYYCSICCDVEVKEYEHTGSCIGIDLGIKNLIICSDGTIYDNAKYTSKFEKKIKHLQRMYSKKTKGSKNREKARKKLAVAHEKLSNSRKDYIHKITTEIIKNSDVICMEDLNVKGMLKNHNLAKSIQDSSFGMISSFLEYKASWHNRQIVKIGRFYPSSKLCNNCGYKNEELTLADRDWICPKCHKHLDRDLNASKNILDEGLRILDTLGTREIEACGEDSSVSAMKLRSSMKQENHKKTSWTAVVENQPSLAVD